MGYFLNIILEDLDNIDDVHYVNEKKLTINEKRDYLKKLFESTGFDKLRFSNLNAVGENPNENYYYFICNVNNLDFITGDIHYENLPILNRLRGSYNNDSNLSIIYIGNEINYKYMNLILNKLGMDNNKLITIDENDVNENFIYKLIGEKNKNLLNIVYDRWDDTNNEYFANLYPSSKDYYRYRIQVGLFRFYNMFKEIRNCKLEEVWLNPDLNYYYFINGDNMYHHFKEEKSIPLPKKVRDCFNNCKNFNIILLNEHEYESESFLIYIDDLIKNDGLDCKRIYMMNNNSKLDFYNKKNNLSINTYSLDFLVKFIANHMVELGEPEFITDKKGDFFLCHNRSPKPHRYALLSLLKKENIIENVDWSLIMGWYYKKNNDIRNINHFFNDVLTPSEIDECKDEITYFTQIDIKKSKYESERSWFDDFGDNPNITWKDVYELKTYEDSYVNIVTESCYVQKEIHITEKSMKPFYFYQFPLFLSSFNHVKFLKERYKFDMFEDIIDHSYDNEIDNNKRLLMLINEIKRIHTNKDLFIEFYKKNKERFVYNRNKVLEIHHSQNDQNYFRNLMHKKYE
jgi:hypothetical protein